MVRASETGSGKGACLHFGRGIVGDSPPARLDIEGLYDGSGSTAINPEGTRAHARVVGIQIRVGRANAGTAGGIGDFGKGTLRTLLRPWGLANHSGGTV